MTNSFAPLLRSLSGDLQDPSVLWQVGVIAVSLLIGTGVSYRVKPRLAGGTGSRLEVGLDNVRRLVLPLTALVLVLAGRAVLTIFQLNINLLNVAVPLLTAMAIISFVVHLQRLVLRPGNLLATFERTIVWLVWLGFAFYVMGLAPDILEFFDNVSFKVGGHRISLLLIGQAFLWVAIALLLSLWIGHLLEDRLMSASGMAMSLRVMLAKLVRALLVLVAGLIVLPLVGIDLTALSVFGGALGVGLGFGLQKVASNYISGFIILLDRSVTIGDLVTIDKNSGKLTKMTARYVVVRAQDGTEAIIPNETVITSAVINQSYTDRKVAISSSVQVSYDSDLELAMRVLCEIAQKNPRVLHEPAPTCLIKGFADSGVELELGAWVEDPEHGVTNLRSEIYLHIWQEFRAHGIAIPYPQREVRVVNSAVAENAK
ncbi:MAG: mechanosensitive ion channel protein MscS [Betaproteobacteria bacterium]|nr:mechanosensitive ion channel protein MscS [Betaproteobacteria bacterium]